MRDDHTLRPARATTIAWLLVMLPIASAAAQSESAPRPVPAATEAAIAELRAALEQHGALLEQQSIRLEAQSREIDDLRQRVNAMGPPAAPSSVAAEDGSAQAAPAAAPSTADDQRGQRLPEMPAAVVSAGDFPGSISIPGTEAAFKIGGQARMMLVHSFGPLGDDDRFVTSSIPVEGEQVAGESRRANYSASPSRLNLDLRSHSPLGPVRSFMEADFAGSGNSMRLRHAFIQTPRRWMVGQT